MLNKIKFRIDYTDSRYLFDIIAKDVELLNEYQDICNVDIEKLVGTKEIEPDDTLPLYTSGFNGTEIAVLRDVSRQLVSPKWKAQAVREGLTEKQATALHKGNRYDMQCILGKARVKEIEQTKDLDSLQDILSKEYQTPRSKYRVFIILGGDIETFEPSEIDRRLVDIDSEEDMKEAFSMFDEGLNNASVSRRLGLELKDIQRFKRNYIRRRNYFSSIL